MTETLRPSPQRPTDRRRALALGALALVLGIVAVVGVLTIEPESTTTDAGRPPSQGANTTATTAAVAAPTTVGTPFTTAPAPTTATTPSRPASPASPTSPTTVPPSAEAGRGASPPEAAAPAPITEHPYTGSEAPLFPAAVLIAVAVACRRARTEPMKD